MNIGLDYDDTYTRDPEVWDAFITLMRARGHKVYLVTWRFEAELGPVRTHHLQYKVDEIHATGRQAKEKHMFEQGICIDVWIDDNPRAILHTMEGY